jgi:hypothetical protein
MNDTTSKLAVELLRAVAPVIKGHRFVDALDAIVLLHASLSVQMKREAQQPGVVTQHTVAGTQSKIH